jgi:hypothetical protein
MKYVMFENYGVLLDDLLVLDADARNGGVQGLQIAKFEHPAIEQCGFVVKTGSGGGSKHLYFKIPAGFKGKIIKSLKKYPGIDFLTGYNRFVVGPGSLHASGNYYEIEHGDVGKIEDIPLSLLLEITEPERKDNGQAKTQGEVKVDEVLSALECIDPDCGYEEWRNIGMGLKLAFDDAGFEIFNSWSMKGSKYEGDHSTKKIWDSFKGQNRGKVITLATLFGMAIENGWVQPPSFTIPSQDEMDEMMRNYESKQDFNPDSIDLTKPPGLVGELAEWFKKRCRTKRDHLAVIASYMTIAAVTGLRYRCDKGAAPNLFAFCTAGSGTGKDSIIMAMHEIFDKLGIVGTVAGSIKSQQEIIRNLLDHQMTNYNIDEFSFLLQKLKNSEASGGAVYLTGVMGELMTLYSRSKGFYVPTGDIKREMRKQLLLDLKQVMGRLGIEGDDDIPAKAHPLDVIEYNSIKQRLADCEKGIREPIVNMLAFTTPHKFDQLVDAEMMVNGFLARVILCREYDNDPEPKWDYVEEPLPEILIRKLKKLYNCGESNILEPRRIEYHGEKTIIVTKPDANARLKEVEKFFFQMGREESLNSAFSPLPKRGYEMVLKLSLISGTDKGFRSLEDVNFAFAYVYSDIRAKLSFANSSEKQDSTDLNEAGIALAKKIDDLFRQGDEFREREITQRAQKWGKGYKAEVVHNMLKTMVENKRLIVREETIPGNGATVKVYNRNRHI